MHTKIIAFLRRPRTALIVIVTVVSFTICAGGQFILRSSANDPQIQMAQDTAALLAAGMPVASISANKNIESTLSPFTIVTDKYGTTIASTALYKNALPQAPRGVFMYAGMMRRMHTVTWQPSNMMRFAAAVTPYEVNGEYGYVLVAKNLREIERRSSGFCGIIFAGWFVSLGVIILTSPTAWRHLRKIVHAKHK